MRNVTTHCGHAAVLQSIPHDSEVNGAQHCTPVPAGEWVHLVANMQVVVVRFPLSCVARVKVRRHSLHAQHTDAVWQHAGQGVHHGGAVRRQLVGVEVDNLQQSAEMATCMQG